MEKKTLTVGIALLLVGVGLGYFFFGAADGQRAASHTMPDGTMMTQNIDQHFIVQMIPHHEGAIDMARLALQKSSRPEIQSLANGIIEAQENEITDMRSWYEEWYGSAPPEGGAGMMHMGGMTGDVTVLEGIADDAFDREFIEQMIPHHEMAIMMAQMLRASTVRPEMQQLADNIITSQSREIAMMRSWLSSWYGAN